MVHQGFVFQESGGVRIALTGASYFIPHKGDVGVAVAKAVVEAFPWKPEGTDVHAAILEPGIAKCTTGEPWADGVQIAKFNYVVGARTPHFVELFATGDLQGSLLIGKNALTLRRSRVPYVLTEDAVAKGWMPSSGSALPPSLERDIPPELRYWNAQDADVAKAARDYIVKSGLVGEDNTHFVDGELRALVHRFELPPAYSDAVVEVKVPQEVLEAPPALDIVEITKALDPESVGTSEVRIVKADAPEEQRYLLGIVLEPDVVDSQNDIYDAEEIRKSAHTFLTTYRNIGLQHVAIVNGLAEIVESYIAPVDMEIGGTVVKKGTWLLGVHVIDDALWEACKDGTLTGLSIGGLACRTPVPAST